MAGMGPFQWFLRIAGRMGCLGINNLLSRLNLPQGPEKVSLAELGRTLGFANSPGTLRILAFIPLLGWLVILLTGIWTLASGIVAVRQSLEFPSARAAVTCLPGWLLYMAVLLLVYVWLPSPFKMFPG